MENIITKDKKRSAKLTYKFFESLNSEFYSIYDKIASVHDESVYLENGHRLYEIFWEIIDDDIRRNYPKKVQAIFNAAFDWAVMVSENVLVVPGELKVKVFMEWIGSFDDVALFSDRFIEIVEEFQDKLEDASIYFAWTAVTDFLNLLNREKTPGEYYMEMVKHTKDSRDMDVQVAIATGRRSLSVLTLINAIYGKDVFEEVFKIASIHFKYIRKYMNNSPWKLFRLFESYTLSTFYERNDEISKQRTPQEGDKFYHYTRVDVLYDILKNKRIKFSNSEMYTDTDEGKMLTPNPKVMYSFSATKNFDSVALWGNYTDNVGVAIELDFKMLVESFDKIAVSSVDENNIKTITFTPFEVGKVIYGRKYKELIKNAVYHSSKLFKKICTPEEVYLLEERFYNIQTHFFKEKPFEYEEELRITIQKRHLTGKNINSAYENENGLFVRINPKTLISKIIVSPTLKGMEYDYKNLEVMVKKFNPDIEIVNSEATIKPK